MNLLIDKLRAMFGDRTNWLGPRYLSLYDCYTPDEVEQAKAKIEEEHEQRKEELMTSSVTTKRTLNEREILIERLRWNKFPVLDDGFICLVDVMGGDDAIVQAARVSFGADERQCETCKGKGRTESDNFDNFADNGTCADCGGSGKMSVGAKHMSDETLIRYLMRHRHTTPVEMCELKFLVRVPMDTWRQWIRHRMVSVNEYSTRYSEAIDSAQKTKPDEWRAQSQSNKQGSAGIVTEWPKGYEVNDLDVVQDAQPDGVHWGLGEDEEKSPGGYLSSREKSLQAEARFLYEERLKFGVAKEQARKDLPLSTYTEAYWKVDLHNLFHFLSLRMDSHAQKEIRDYANIIGNEIVKPLFPIAWKAFEDYRLNAMHLTAKDIEAIKHFGGDYEEVEYVNQILEKVFSNKRERQECFAKLQRLEIIS